MTKEIILVTSREHITNEDGVVVSIEEELEELTVEEFEGCYDVFANGSPSSQVEIPLYEIIWKRFVSPGPVDDPRLLHLVLLFKRLEGYVERHDVESIRYEDLDNQYRALAHDFADAYNLDINVSPPKRKSRLRRYALSVAGLWLFFFDQLAAQILKYLFDRPRELSTVIVPSVGRIHSIEHVFEELTTDYNTLVTQMTLGWFWSRPKSLDLPNINPIPVTSMISLGTALREVRFLLLTLRRSLIDARFDKEVEALLSEDLDVQMPRSVEYEVTGIIKTPLLRSLLYYMIFDDVFDDRGCETLVVNSAAPTGKAILAAGVSHNVELYHLRHSVVTGYTPEPPFDATEFVEGEVAIDHLNEVPYVSDMSNFVPTGYQYLAEMYGQESTRFEPKEPLNVFIGTQPFDDQTRETFVRHALDGIDSMPVETSIVIKTHPSESPDIYERFSDRPDVTVVTSNLRDHLRKADLAINVISNVGLEAMMMDTPCICINKWRPLFRTHPYAHHCHVPVVESEREVREYFNKLNIRALVSLYNEQQAALRDKYELDGNATERMVDMIESEGEL